MEGKGGRMKVVILLFVIILIHGALAVPDGNSTGQNSTGDKDFGGDPSPQLAQSPPASTLTGNDSTNRSESAKFQGPYDVHVYVSNKDDDSLDVSLFIDFELKDSKSVSSRSESEFGVFPLPAGQHSFKITWWDEDVRRPFEAEETSNVLGESSVNLYTTANDEPEKFDLTVSLDNENSKDLEAFLYVDENFEKNREISKESTSDIGTISLEEGVHNLSVRWRDADTRIEYEKKKRITVSKDDAVVFYVPAGISFDAEESRSTEETQGSSDSSLSTMESPLGRESYSSATILEGNSSPSGEEGEKDALNESSGSADSYPSGVSDFSEEPDSGGSDREARGIGAFSTRAVDSGNSLYAYAAIVILAIYLIFRH